MASSKRISSLDGLRAVSIAAVLLAHTTWTLSSNGVMAGVGPQVAALAALGVRVFFVISGFLITGLLLKEEQQAGSISLTGFYMRRCLRIWPVYFCYIGVVFLVSHHSASIPWSTFVSALTFTTHLWGQWQSANCWPLAHTWSLAIEEQFYLLWPTLLLLLARRPRFRWGVVWSVIGGALVIRPLIYKFVSHEAAGDLFITQGDCIMIGCLAALAVQFHPGSVTAFVQRRTYLGRICAAALILLSCFALPPRVSIIISPTVESFCAAYLIVSLALVPRGLDYAFLNFSVIKWIGRLSYSLYMWQQLFLVPAAIATDVPVLNSWVIRFPQNLILAFCTAVASYYLVEKPFLSLKDRFAWIGRKKPLLAEMDSAAVPTGET